MRDSAKYMKKSLRICMDTTPYNRQFWAKTGFPYWDQVVIDAYHSWSIFTMYWPQIAFYTLIGRE